MKYNLKNDNYKNFSIFKDNVMYPRSYFIPFSSTNELDGVDIRNERYSSKMVDCLSGEWEFKYYDNCLSIPDSFDTAAIEFDKVSVPSTWQHTGYEPPYYVNTRYQFKPKPPVIPEDCPAGVYRKSFNVDMQDDNYYLTFLGVAGGLDVFVNGEYVGYSEGSHNTAQFEITKLLSKGDNELVVLVHKWTNSTYLECQDMFRCNGIFRDVLLYKTKNNSIYDIYFDTKYLSNNSYSLDVIPSLKLVDDCELSVSIYDDGELVANTSVNQSKDKAQMLSFSKLDVKEWNAEEPYLYDAIIALSKNGEIIEVIKKSIGFKHIEIEGNVFKLNNKPIKLLGVNHHDSNTKTGYVLTVEEMEAEISIIKQYNCNCIRTSHYPPDPTFLDLCDEYGIYIVDEADIETHGCEVELHRPGACSHNPKWREHYWDRVYRMYERDKNHASITMWSLGNEAHGYSNQDYCYDNLKKLTSIPIHYEAACRTRRWAYDVISQMYTFPGICEKIAKGHGLPRKFYKKPFYLCEYAHAMGVGAGELERYVKCFYSSENMLGGCIWEFKDHAIYHKDGPYEYTYGGDHGEWKHDSNFCVDGLFYPDLTPHSGAKQMKNCYRPVRATKISDTKYSFKNYGYFKTADLTLKYTVLEDGISILSDELNISIKPQDSIELDVNNFKYDKSKNTVIQFEYYDGDFFVANEEIKINEGQLVFSKKGKPPVVKESEKRLFIDFDNGSMIFNKATGCIDSYVFAGKEFINQIPSTNFKGFGISHYRAPIDNDMYISIIWKKYHLDNAVNIFKNVKHSISDDALIITSKIKVKTPVKLNASVNKSTLTIYSDGTIKADYECVSAGAVKFIPRYGVQLEMPKEFKNIKYFGLGPEVNLMDYREHALMGIYETECSKMHENYIKPQESATRCETRFAQITNDDGIGIQIDAINNPFVFSVNPYSPIDCAKAGHREDLTANTTCINIDSEMLGAGSNACGPMPSKNYRLGSLKGKRLSFAIKPIKV